MKKIFYEYRGLLIIGIFIAVFSIDLFEKLFAWLRNFNPDISFLSDIAAFEAAIIAFLVPLSIEIISKISERYNSDVITRVFEDQWENKILAPALLLNIVSAITLRFFIHNSADSMIWKISAWVMMIVFIFVAYAIWKVISNIKSFMSDTSSIINKLYEDIEKSLK